MGRAIGNVQQVDMSVGGAHSNMHTSLVVLCASRCKHIGKTHHIDACYGVVLMGGVLQQHFVVCNVHNMERVRVGDSYQCAGIGHPWL